jgi:hypothetical protein
MCRAESHSGVQAVVIEDARCRREQDGVVVVLSQERCRMPAKEPVHGWDGERRRWRRRRSCDIGGDLLDTLSSGVHWSLAWIAVAEATVVAATVTTAVQDEGAATTALSRTTMTSLSKSARATAAVAMVAEADAMALAAEASTVAEAAETSTAVSKAMATCKGRVAILSLEKTKECRGKSRQVSCHLYLPFLLFLP